MAKMSPAELATIGSAIESLRSAFDNRAMRDLLAQTDTMARMSKAFEELATRPALAIDPRALQAGRALAEQFSALTSSKALGLDLGTNLKAFAEAMRHAESMRIAEMSEMAAALAPLTAAQESLAHATLFAQLADASQARLNSQMLALAAAGQDIHSALAEATRHFGQSFRQLFDQIGAPDALFSVPPLVIERPPQEAFIHYRLVEAITDRTAEPDRDDDVVVTSTEYADLASEAESELTTGLVVLDTRLVAMWRGAREALRSPNPDRLRQACASQRELVMHVVHLLAPDETVRKWTTSPDDFDESGRPKRRTRLHFIARKVNQDRFSAFLRKDLAAALEAIDVLNGGVHGLDSTLSDAQARLLMLRIDHLLAFLLEVSKTEA